MAVITNSKQYVRVFKLYSTVTANFVFLCQLSIVSFLEMCPQLPENLKYKGDKVTMAFSVLGNAETLMVARYVASSAIHPSIVSSR